MLPTQLGKLTIGKSKIGFLLFFYILTFFRYINSGMGESVELLSILPQYKVN
jgi:hypothetical protein